MEIDLFDIFCLGVDHGQLTMEEDFFDNNWADTMGIIVTDRKHSMNSQIIQRQPRSEKWKDSKRKSYKVFVDLLAKVYASKELVNIKNNNQNLIKMSKGTEQFKTTIQQYLEKRAAEDSLFAETLKKENKSIDECINYILSEVQKSGVNGFADEEIFGMAVHYYDEDDLKAVKQNSSRVVVNHKVELSEDDLATAKEEGMKLAIEEAKIEAKKTIGKKIKLSDEDLAEFKQQSIQELVVEAKEKLKQKAKKKQLKEVSAGTEVEQINLFE